MVVLVGCIAAEAAQVSVRFDREVEEAAFLERVPPDKFKADKHVPVVFKAEKSDEGFAAVLKPGVYDLRLRLPGGEIVEGVTLKMGRPEDSGPLKEGDQQRLKDYVAHMKTFYDVINVFVMEGWRGRDETGVEGRARLLVECLRHRPYHLSGKKGSGRTVVWRLEKWEFERLGGGWRKLKDFEVLYRLSPDIEAFRRYKWFFCRELGGIEVKEQAVDLGLLKVPDVKALPGRVGLPEEDDGKAEKDGEVSAVKQQ